MLKRDYMATPEVAAFSTWLSRVVNGSQTIDFKYGPRRADQWTTLHDALNAYSWPDRANHGPQQAEPTWTFPPGALFTLHAKSDFAANELVLARLSNGLKAASTASHADVAKWIASILVWGGVYKASTTGKGNRPWVLANVANMNAILKQVAESIEAGDDAFKRNHPTLRFNAGMTKVYSLLVTDFVIYDSRVAAALAWLVLKWRKHNALEARIPLSEHLNFGCMTPSESKNAKLQKQRNPETSTFRYVRNNAHMHVKWNMRANWILAKAHQDSPTASFKSLRHLEAALFVIGYDLRYSSF